LSENGATKFRLEDALKVAAESITASTIALDDFSGNFKKTVTAFLGNINKRKSDMLRASATAAKRQRRAT
jgi:hypothetical protein